MKKRNLTKTVSLTILTAFCIGAVPLTVDATTNTVIYGKSEGFGTVEYNPTDDKYIHDTMEGTSPTSENVILTVNGNYKSVLGGFQNDSSRDCETNHNIVKVLGGTIGYRVYGGYARSIDISNNTKNATAIGNEVTISGTTDVADEIEGGYAEGKIAIANQNIVNITGGSVKNVYGGQVFGRTAEAEAKANENVVNISGGKINGVVYAACGQIEDVGKIENVNVDRNIINVSKSADLSAATLVGSCIYHSGYKYVGKGNKLFVNSNWTGDSITVVKVFDFIEAGKSFSIGTFKPSPSDDFTLKVNELNTTVTIGTLDKDSENKALGDKYITIEGNSNVRDQAGEDVERGLATLAKALRQGSGPSYTYFADKVYLPESILYGEASATVDSIVDDAVTLSNFQQKENLANVGIVEIANLSYISLRQQMNDMNKRMGELRNANGEHGVWVRMVRGEMEYKSINNRYNQYQLGYDEKLSVDKRWTVGAAVSYTEGDNNFERGSGETKNTALALYGSKLNNDGSFIDLIAKYARIENDFEVSGTSIGNSDYGTNAYSVSAEVGKRYQQGNGLWIEPQAELTYGTVSSVDYHTSEGANVHQDKMDSLVGRLGFSLGKDIKEGNVYARASYLYDFDGETEVTMSKGTSNTPFKQDLGGGWWEVGVGANINLSKSTYIYADVEKTFGGEVDTNWQWNLGVRYSF